MIVIISKIERFADTPPSLLDEGHFEQYGKAKSAKRRAEITAGAGIFRYALKEYGFTFGDEPLPVKFTGEGKPYLQDGPCFSLSHSGDLIVCAVDADEVGVDIERVSKFAKTRIARKILNPFEENAFAGISDTDEAAKYLAVKWTGKEAIAKLIGKGLGVAFSKFHEEDCFMHTFSFVSDGVSYIVRTASEK